MVINIAQVECAWRNLCSLHVESHKYQETSIQTTSSWYSSQHATIFSISNICLHYGKPEKAFLQTSAPQHWNSTLSYSIEKAFVEKEGKIPWAGTALMRDGSLQSAIEPDPNYTSNFSQSHHSQALFVEQAAGYVPWNFLYLLHFYHKRP